MKSSANDKAVLISFGVTVHECLKAFTSLGAESIYFFYLDIAVRVVDLFSLKPLDVEGIKKNVE